MKEGIMKNSIIERIMVTSLLLVISLVFTGSQLLSAAEPKPQYGGTLKVADTFEGISIGYPPKKIQEPKLSPLRSGRASSSMMGQISMLRRSRGTWISI
jgi:hypothetical protein